MRLVPDSLLTFSRAAYFMSFVRNENFSSTEYEPLMHAILVSLSRIDLLEVVREHEVVDRLLLLATPGFQPSLPTVARWPTNAMTGVPSRRKCVCMSMMNWPLSAFARSFAMSGVWASARDTT